MTKKENENKEVDISDTSPAVVTKDGVTIEVKIDLQLDPDKLRKLEDEGITTTIHVVT